MPLNRGDVGAAADPGCSGAYHSYFINSLMFSALIALDDQLRPQPDIAASWAPNADGAIWRFNLRQDVRWTDGTAVTAHDFEWAVKRNLAPNLYCGGQYWQLVDLKGARAFYTGEEPDPATVGIRALDDYTLEVANERVQQVLGRTWPATAQVGLGAVLLALGLGVPLGVSAATGRGREIDHLGRAVSVAGAAPPVYVLGTLCVVIFSARLKLVPLIGWGAPARAILPICVLALGPLATVIRFTRAATLETLGADYVRTAHAKGLKSRQVIGRHVLKNALLPVLTLSGPLAAHLLTGSFFVETIFNVPGMAAAFVYAAADRDYPLIMAGAVLSGGLIILLNLAVDLAYGLLDPRIRLARNG